MSYIEGVCSFVRCFPGAFTKVAASKVPFLGGISGWVEEKGTETVPRELSL